MVFMSAWFANSLHRPRNVLREPVDIANGTVQQRRSSPNASPAIAIRSSSPSCATIDANVPPQLDIYLIVDNYTTHKHHKALGSIAIRAGTFTSRRRPSLARGGQMNDIATDSEALRGWLFHHVLPLWWKVGSDRHRGGFHEAIDLEGGSVARPHRARSITRMAFSYCEAGRLGWDGPLAGGRAPCA
jgi:hypothetical protein